LSSLVITNNPLPDICEKENPFDLSQTTSIQPQGGTWKYISGPNPSVISGNFFNPNLPLVSGDYMLKYSHDLTGCLVEKNIPVRVNPIPVVTATKPAGTDFICITDPDVPLTGNPAGGTWTGQGIFGNSFKPTISGSGGPFSLRYDYTEPTTGCKSKDSVTISVQDAPTVKILSSNLNACERIPFPLQSKSTNNPGITWSTNGDGTFFDIKDSNTTYLPGNNDRFNGSVILTITTDPIGVCPIATEDILVTIHPIPVADFSAINRKGCAPLNVNFNSTVTKPTTGLSYLWDFGDVTSGVNNISTLPNPSHLYDKKGLYTVTLKIFTDKGCDTTIIFTNYVEVYEVPVAKFISDPDRFTTVALPKFKFLNQSTPDGNLFYLWNFGTGNPTDTSNKKNPIFTYPSDTATYRVMLSITTDKGCVDTVGGTVIIGPDITVFIPNAFTPDGSGPLKNDRFFVTAQGFINFQISIFNRWGEMMYQSQDIKDGWDGKYRSIDAQQDVYIYKVRLTSYSGNVYYYNGTITLLR